MHRIYQTLQHRKPELTGFQNLNQFAVMVPLVEVDGEWNVLFEERAHHLKRQPGEICFPGGKIDLGAEDEKTAAIRETCEELGLESQYVEVIGPLNVLVSPFQIVYPFAGRIIGYDKIRPNPDEVASVFCVPLAYLLSYTPELHFVELRVTPPEHFPFERIPNGRDYKWRTGKIPEYFYEYEGRTIWGLTARILHHFLELAK